MNFFRNPFPALRVSLYRNRIFFSVNAYIVLKFNTSVSFCQAASLIIFSKMMNRPVPISGAERSGGKGSFSIDYIEQIFLRPAVDIEMPVINDPDVEPCAGTVLKLHDHIGRSIGFRRKYCLARMHNAGLLAWIIHRQ